MKNLFTIILVAFSISLSAQSVTVSTDGVIEGITKDKSILPMVLKQIKAKSVKVKPFTLDYKGLYITVSWNNIAEKYEVERDDKEDVIIHTIAEAKAIVKQYLFDHLNIKN